MTVTAQQQTHSPETLCPYPVSVLFGYGAVRCNNPETMEVEHQVMLEGMGHSTISNRNAYRFIGELCNRLIWKPPPKSLGSTEVALRYDCQVPRRVSLPKIRSTGIKSVSNVAAISIYDPEMFMDGLPSVAAKRVNLAPSVGHDTQQALIDYMTLRLTFQPFSTETLEHIKEGLASFKTPEPVPRFAEDPSVYGLLPELALL